MAKRIKSGIKQHRQSMKRRDRNTIVKSDLKTQVKKITTFIENKDHKGRGRYPQGNGIEAQEGGFEGRNQ